MNIEDLKFQDIFSGAKSRSQLWIKVLKATDAKTIVEVGVWKGDFAKELLEECKFIERYYMIDPWANLPDWNKPFNVDGQVFDDVYVAAMKKTAFASEKIIVLSLNSEPKLPPTNNFHCQNAKTTIHKAY